MLTGVLGFVAANWSAILGFRRKTQKEDLEIGEQLMTAIDDGREKILKMYVLVDSMEAENKRLKKENMTLTIERDQFKELADKLRDELTFVKKDLDECAKKVREKYQTKPPEHPRQQK